MFAFAPLPSIAAIAAAPSFDQIQRCRHRCLYCNCPCSLPLLLAQISRIQQDHDHQESTLWAYQEDELPRLQLQAENEMREKPSALRKEHEIQMNHLKMQHEDDYKKLQDELELQKSKEEKHRALWQLQWKVMGESQKDKQEVNSKKDATSTELKCSQKVEKGNKGSAVSVPMHRKEQPPCRVSSCGQKTSHCK